MLQKNISNDGNESIIFQIRPDKAFAFLLSSINLLAVIFAAIHIFVYKQESFTYKNLEIFIVIAVFFLIISHVLILYYIKHKEYVITNRVCSITTTFITMNKNIIPLSRIVDVNLSQSIIFKLFGIASITLYTQSGIRKSNPSIIGIKLQDAERIFEYLKEHINKLPT